MNKSCIQYISSIKDHNPPAGGTGRRLSKFAEEYRITKPLQALSSDISYIPTKEGFEEGVEKPYKDNRKTPIPKYHVNIACNEVYREYLQFLLLLDEIDPKFLVDKKYILPATLQQLYIEILKNYKKGKEKLILPYFMRETESPKPYEDIVLT